MKYYARVITKREAINHFAKPIIEVYIKYYDCNNNKRTFEYCEEI